MRCILTTDRGKVCRWCMVQPLPVPRSKASDELCGDCRRCEILPLTSGKEEGTPNKMAQQDDSASSLRQTFPGYYRPTDEEFDRLWEEGMFVVDTNVLLNLYRYSHVTRDELLGVLRALEDRLFLPHQVGQEFLDKRLRTIRGQRERFAKLRERVTSVRGEMEDELRAVLRLRPGEELPEGLRDALEEVPPGGYEALSDRLEALERELPQTTNSSEDDEVWTAIEALVDGKVGPPYDEEQQRKAEEEAERRRNDKIPPGFKDERPGDYLLWSQTINEAKRTKRPVVLVTDDRKEDWWWIEHGEIIGPRPELVAEMHKESGMPFYMYTPDRLMRAAKDRLNIRVSEESISEAEGLDREARNEAAEAFASLWRAEALPDFDDRKYEALLAHLFYGNDISGVEELGLSRAEVRRSLYLTLMQLLTDKAGEAEREEAFGGIRPWTPPPPGTGTFINNLDITVQGSDDGIAAFNKKLLHRLPELTIDRPNNGSATGDTILELRFRPPVEQGFVMATLATASGQTGVHISGTKHDASME